MNTQLKSTAAAAVLAIVAALGATAAVSADEPAAKLKCSDILWNGELLAKYPKAPAACQEVAVRDGKKYARFTANVTSVSADTVKLKFTNVVGMEGRELSVKPKAGAMVTIEGKKIAFAKLQRGDVLTFWIAENRVGVISDPADTVESEIELK
ncbi:MAG TPA: hypothetical protein VE046_00030 [Steroidobacteraceae bacterium]|nr:hypothetical protein [Steroidobacteraceae bacterium]